MENDERDLIDSCIRGDSRAWESLVKVYGPSVYSAARFTLRRVLGVSGEADVENVVQTVFVALCEKKMRRLRSFQGRARFRTWLTSVTTRYALNHVRTEKRKGSLKYCSLEESFEERLPRDESGTLPPEEREELFQGLDRLPPRDRLLLKMFYFDGASYQSIAEMLRVEVNSVSPLLSRAKEALRKSMETS